MSNAVFAIAEFSLVFLVVIGVCVWELRKLKKYKAIDDEDRAQSRIQALDSTQGKEKSVSESEEANRGLFGVKPQKKAGSWKR